MYRIDNVTWLCSFLGTLPQVVQTLCNEQRLHSCVYTLTQPCYQACRVSKLAQSELTAAFEGSNLATRRKRAASQNLR